MQNKSKVCKNKFVSIVLISFFVFGLFCFNTFEPASAYTGTITYDSGTDTITCVGGSSGTPITFNDIYEADIFYSWGIFNATGKNINAVNKIYSQFITNASIKIGNATHTAFFKDTEKQVTFIGNVQIYVSANSVFQIGEIVDSNYKTSRKGCQLQFNTNEIDEVNCIYGEDLSTINLFSSSIFSIRQYENIQHIGTGNSTQLRLYQVQTNFNVKCIYGDIVDLKDVFWVNVRGFPIRCRGIMDNLSIFSTHEFGLHACVGLDTNWGGTISNLNVKIPGTFKIFRGDSLSTNIYLIDTDTTTWLMEFSGVDLGGKVFRQYTFNINVLNGEITDFVENATVQLWKDSNLIYEGYTNSSGMIPTQTLTYGFYQQSTGNTIQNASSPYYLVITHPEWQTYISRFYITEPLRLTVSMQEPTVTGYTEAEKSDYTTIILFVISTILCIMGLALTVPLLPLISLTINVLNIIFLSEPTIFNILLIILNVAFTLITLVRVKTKNN